MFAQSRNNESSERHSALSPQFEAKLFGSRASGKSRPNSDWDLLLVDPALAARILYPAPEDNPMVRKDGVLQYHAQRHEWSTAVWQRFGGDSEIAALRRDVRSRTLRDGTIPLAATDLDLFIYIPPSLSPSTWAVRLLWTDELIMADLMTVIIPTLAVKGGPGFHQILHTTMTSNLSDAEKRQALSKAIKEHYPELFPNSLGNYSSLQCLTRDEPEYENLARLTSLP